MNAIEALNLAFPKTSNKNQAVCGNIPMAEFVAMEPALRKIMKENGLKVVYRGPRVSNRLSNMMRTTTVRKDAVSVLLYRK